ncbi:hypothetical protein A5742_14610 [Mycolicibacterium fortuitum]|uniref:Uncharacterized protein n=1 Tax=Mycolicibacterium fortuitum TaxID=1766 RepID=A0ABD6QD29_MYCFO|nr:alpha/beta fold hydrolase [Mycolicibacterium fortuitum]OMC33125.1 hypothetical protein A5742_14610 [Mycolicibacterium fortuitum]
MFITATDGVQIHCQDIGRGPAVVLIAGFGLDGSIWGDTATRLIQSGYRVILLDQRGHGRSDKPVDGYDLPQLSSDVRCVLDGLGVTRATLVGHSFGGQVAMHAAVTMPDRVDRLVLVGSNGVRGSRSAVFPFGLLADSLMPAMCGAEMDHRVAARRNGIVLAFSTPPPEDLARTMVATSLQLPQWAALAIFETMFTADLTAELDTLNQPVLQVLGIEDRVHSVKGARWVAERLKDAELVEVPGCGHFPMLEHPAAFADALLAFLAGNRGRFDQIRSEIADYRWPIVKRTVSRIVESKGSTMSENTDAVNAFYTAINAKDAEALTTLVAERFAKNAAVEFPAGLPYGGRIEGAPQLAKVFAGMAGSPVPVGPHNIDITDVLEDGDQVAVRVAFDWSMPKGTAIRSTAIELWRFTDGKVIEMSAYYWDTVACQLALAGGTA